ncbi:MAG: hypothetical protein JSS99_17960 [Actinobacteria bacterium]|nr:hypothetical protein [Actinomycetota bacterium]
MKGERWLAVCCCVLAAALVVGCGTSTPATPTHATVPATAPAQPQPESRRTAYAPNPWKEPPAPPAHPGARVDRLIVHDVKLGRGLAVRPRDSVEADYIEANYTTGRKFLWGWGRGRTGDLVLTPYVSMRGLIRGMTGMRPGGRRTIIVPPRLSDVNDPDRRGTSYRQIVYFDVVLRRINGANP